MRKIKQVDRPFLIFRHGLVGRTLYDSCTSIDSAKVVASTRHKKYPREKIEVFRRGELQFKIEART